MRHDEQQGEVMKGTKRRAGLVAAAAGLMIMGAASVAWACTQQAYIGSISPGSGPAGSRATITASRFNPGPVQIRWNGTDGPLLATASGPSFSVGITIPDSRLGDYTVVAVQRQNDVIVGKASVPFQVTPAGAFSQGGYSSNDGTSTADGGQDASGGVTRSSTAGEDSSGAGESPSGQPAAGSGGTAFPSEASSATAASPDAGASTGQTASRAVSSGSGPAGQAANGAVPSAASGVARASDETIRPAQPSLTPTDEAAGTIPSRRSATADLWGGFTDGQPARGVGLSGAPASGGGTSPLAVGAGLLTAGLVALFAGFGVAEHGRRRALAAAPRQGGQS